MKSLMTFAFLALSAGAFARPALHQLPTGAEAVSPIAGEIVSVRPLCPNGARCLVDGTIVTIDFPLHGCADELLVTGDHPSPDPDNYEIFNVTVSALNVFTKDSQSMLCVSAPRATKEFRFINQFGKPRVHFLGTGITKTL